MGGGSMHAYTHACTIAPAHLLLNVHKQIIIINDIKMKTYKVLAIESKGTYKHTHS